MTFENVMPVMSFAAIVAAIVLAYSNLATKRELAASRAEMQRFRHKVKNFVHVVINADSFEDLREVKWKDLDDGNGGHED